MKGPKIFSAGILVLLLAVSAQAAIIRVPANYPTIQLAIDAARNGDIVIVANGTYTGAGNKDLDFKGKAITVKSENGPKSTIIDCEGVGKGFYFHSGESSASVVSGFTIRKGSPGGDLIQIASSAQTGEKMVNVDVEKDTTRPENDGDVAPEPGETMGLDIALENMSSSSIHSAIATLKTDDPRVTGLVPIYTGTHITGWDTVSMAGVGISVNYGTILGNSTRLLSFQFVKISQNFTPLGDYISFTLNIKSGSNFIGSDEFSTKVGADIVLDRVDVDRDLKPGSSPENIDVRLRNITANDIEEVRVVITPDTRDVDIDEDRVEIGEIRANRSEEASFETEIDDDFKGYVQFMLSIEVDRVPINIESFSYYFGMRTQYVACWITDDYNNNGVAEPGEKIELQIARLNLTAQEAQDVESILDTADYAIVSIDESEGDYRDIPAYEVATAKYDYEFTVDDENASVFLSNPDFDMQGHTVEFTLDTTEDREPMGEETFLFRIGGVIRHLLPDSYYELMDTMSDATNLGPTNNGNGLPEPGEIIEIEVTLTNISDDDAEYVEAELDSDDDVSIIVDEEEYGEIKDGREKTRTFLFEIDDDFQGSRITFELEIKGEINRHNENFGIDTFSIPVWPGDRNSFASTSEVPEPAATSSTVTDSSLSDGFGGGIYCMNSSPTIENNIITENSVSQSGGGIYCGNNASPLIVNNVISRNTASEYGGGIYCTHNSYPTIVNNTITENTATIGGDGIGCRSSSFPKVLNTILWGNGSSEIFTDSASGINITYSDIEGGWSGAGNISANPRFVNPISEDYHLMDSSPCIGVGDMIQSVPNTDIEGNPRPDPAGSKPDMGAYESPLPLVFPKIIAVTPTSLSQGASGQYVVVGGMNFLNGAIVSFSGIGITVKSITFVSPAELKAKVDIAANAPAGTRDVIVTNPDGQTGTGEDMFTVVSTGPVETTTVKVEAGQTVGLGDSFPVAINVEDVTDLAGFQLDIVFNPAILEATQVDEGAFLSGGSSTYWLPPDIDNTAGMITGIASARTGTGGVNGSGTLATVTFKAVGTGVGYITLQSVMLSDSIGQLIPVTPVDGSVTVTEFPPWDVNNDGRVDIFDLVIVGQYFGEVITTPLDPNPDVNHDGVVNIFDVVAVGQHFGETYSATAPSGDLWSVDPQYLNILSKLYGVMESDTNPDPAFRDTKEILCRLISNARVDRTEVFQNYPNPFNPETWIPFQLSEASEVEIRIYNSVGRLVRVLDLGFRNVGYYASREDSARWDGTNESGEKVASGLYFYTIRAGEYTATRRMLLVK